MWIFVRFDFRISSFLFQLKRNRYWMWLKNRKKNFDAKMLDQEKSLEFLYLTHLNLSIGKKEVGENMSIYVFQIKWLNGNRFVLEYCQKYATQFSSVSAFIFDEIPGFVQKCAIFRTNKLENFNTDDAVHFLICLFTRERTQKYHIC